MDGSVTVELAVLAPALLVLVFSVVQVGVWSYARSLALAAAQEGVTAARVQGAGVEAGRERAESFLRQTAGDSLRDGQIRVDRTAVDVKVEVSGRALSVLPGVPGLLVRQSAAGPIERFTTP